MLEEYIPQTFLLLALAHWLALLSPGQDFVLLVTQTLRFGHQRSRYVAFGIALGNLAYITLVILVGSKLRDFPLLFSVIQWLGVAYLAWIGIQLIQAKPVQVTQKSRESQPRRSLQAFSLGLGSALLNPKNALFYLSLMSSILGPYVTLEQQVFSGLWMFFVVLFWDWLLILFIGRPKFRQTVHKYLHWLERVSGGVFVGLAGLLAVWR